MIDLFDTNQPAYTLNGTDYGDAIFAERVHDLITSHDPSIPFFLYYAFQINHFPLEAPLEYWSRFGSIENEKRRNYTAMTPYMDDKVEREALRQRDPRSWQKMFDLTYHYPGPHSPDPYLPSAPDAESDINAEGP